MFVRNVYSDGSSTSWYVVATIGPLDHIIEELLRVLHMEDEEPAATIRITLPGGLCMIEYTLQPPSDVVAEAVAVIEKGN